MIPFYTPLYFYHRISFFPFVLCTTLKLQLHNTCLLLYIISSKKPGILIQLCKVLYLLFWGFYYGSAVNNLPSNAGNVGLIPGWRRSPKEGNANPLQYSCLGNLKDMNLVVYSSWGHKRNKTYWLNNNYIARIQPYGINLINSSVD